MGGGGGGGGMVFLNLNRRTTWGGRGGGVTFNKNLYMLTYADLLRCGQIRSHGLMKVNGLTIDTLDVLKIVISSSLLSRVDWRLHCEKKSDHLGWGRLRHLIYFCICIVMYDNWMGWKIKECKGGYPGEQVGISQKHLSIYLFHTDSTYTDLYS